MKYPIDSIFLTLLSFYRDESYKIASDSKDYVNKIESIGLNYFTSLELVISFPFTPA